MRVLAAMSGGVDSAVAAALAVTAGHDVTGVHLALLPDRRPFRDGNRGCCSLDDARDARRAADTIGIPFYVWDFAERFRAEVVDDFVAEYAAGRTPNPCLRCNERIKFAALLERAVALGFDAVCTGHYARLVDGDAGVELHRGTDPAKDQSYVLAVVPAASLRHVLLPLGGLTKPEVRAAAAARGLAVAAKPDSHDICFIPTGDTAGFLRDRLGDGPGPIVDATTGSEVGRHGGAYSFTVGQRRGLALDRPAADHRKRYVVRVEPAAAAVYVGPPEMLDVDVIRTGPPTWCGPPARPGAPLGVQVRAHGDVVPGRLAAGGAAGGGPGPDDARAALEVRLERRLRGVAPGQTVAWYDGTRVVGSATIEWAGVDDPRRVGPR